MTLNDLEWLFHDKMRFWPALLESERLNVRNSTTTLHYITSHYISRSTCTYTYTATAEKQRVSCAYMTRCFSAVAELLVLAHRQTVPHKQILEK